MLEKRLRIVGKNSVLEFGEHNVSILNLGCGKRERKEIGVDLGCGQI